MRLRPVLLCTVAAALAAACAANRAPAVTPTRGGVEVTWFLVGATSGNRLPCSVVGNASLVDVRATGATSGALARSFPCDIGTGIADGWPFGAWTVSVSLTSAGGAAIATTSFGVALSSSGCDLVVDESCLKTETVDLSIAGK